MADIEPSRTGTESESHFGDEHSHGRLKCGSLGKEVRLLVLAVGESKKSMRQCGLRDWSSEGESVLELGIVCGRVQPLSQLVTGGDGG